jgi:KaiC/GvpD/RAD55 family RecA-like ATPase
VSEEVRQMKLTPASAIRSSRQRWLWNSMIPMGTVCLFAGRGGEGKSSFALYLAASLNKGSLKGDLYGESTGVLIVSIEDDWGHIMKPRLVAAGANLDNVWKFDVTVTVDEVTRERTMELPLDVALIRKAIAETGAKLLILDPASSLMTGDLNKREDARQSLDALASVAHDTDCTVILILHFNKGVGNVSEKISGNHALRDAARSVILFATDEESGNRIASVDKSNYSASADSSFSFTLTSTAVNTDEGDATEVARVIFQGASNVSVNDIVNRGESDRSEAEYWLTSYLTDRAGTAPAGEIHKAAANDGMGWDAVKRASQKITQKGKSGFQGHSIWTLDFAKVSAKGANSAGAQTVAPSAPFGGNLLPMRKNASVESSDISARRPRKCPVCGEKSPEATAVNSYRHPGCEPDPGGADPTSLKLF